jgi:hypothetical protein
VTAPQLLRLAATARCVMRALQHAVVRFHSHRYRSCWETLGFELDAVQPRAESREHKAFRTLLPGWLAAWSITHPITLVEEWQTTGHPFLRDYGRDDGVDIGAVVKKQLSWESSAASPGIQMADMAASIVAGAIANVSGSSLSDYGILMRRALLERGDELGVFSVVPTPQEEITSRYGGLLDAARQYAEFNES